MFGFRVSSLGRIGSWHAGLRRWACGKIEAGLLTRDLRGAWFQTLQPSLSAQSKLLPAEICQAEIELLTQAGSCAKCQDVTNYVRSKL